MYILMLIAGLSLLAVGLTFQYGVGLSGGGSSIQKTINRTGDSNVVAEVTLPVACPLSSWVKTDADTAAGNLAGGHGQTSGTYDVFWTGGRRYGVDVTITTNAVALDGGSGTDFPASANATVTIVKQTVINVAIDGDAVSIAGFSLEYTDASLASAGQLTLKDSGAADIAHLDLVGGAPVVYDITGGATNPFTGNPIVVAYGSQANSTYTATLKILALVDSTP